MVLWVFFVDVLEIWKVVLIVFVRFSNWLVDNFIVFCVGMI